MNHNIILILCDDMGHWAMGCAGNEEIHTPNLDRLAATGMRFENFFCTSPVCSPARASIFTGKMPSQHGVQDWLANHDNDSQEYLQGQTTYPELLSKNGYTCGISGKWHLGNAKNKQMGFSHWYVYHSAQADYYGAPMIRNGESATESGYITDCLTNDALSFLSTQTDRQNPFYLSVHYTAPHKPWIDCHPHKYLDMYKNCPFDSIPSEPKHPWQIDTHPWPEGEERRKTLQGYFAAVTAMDAGIGQIIDFLEREGMRDNTLIFFMSDNGMNMGHHGIVGKGNGTFPMNLYDTSVKVPAIASQPGVIPQGVVCHSLLSQYDFMPTVLDWASVKLPYPDGLPGHSFADILRSGEEKHHSHIVVYDEYGPVRMIRNSEWKYIHRYPYGPHELYNIKDDPSETANLYEDGTKQDIASKMKAQLDNWFNQYADPAIDASREPVTGWGQVTRPGVYANGATAFFQSRGSIKKIYTYSK